MYEFLQLETWSLEQQAAPDFCFRAAILWYSRSCELVAHWPPTTHSFSLLGEADPAQCVTQAPPVGVLLV